MSIPQQLLGLIKEIDSLNICDFIRKKLPFSLSSSYGSRKLNWPESKESRETFRTSHNNYYKVQ
jgi:hypothetical protein